MASNLRKRLNGLGQAAAIRGMLALERFRSGVTFNPLGKEFTDNPYPIYRRILAKDPVHRSRLLGGWALARHRDVNAVLRDERFMVDQRKLPDWPRYRERMLREGVMTEKEVDEQSLLGLDRPDHDRLRSLVNKAFTPRSVEALRPRIQELVDEQLGAAQAEHSMDVMEQIARPLPMTVIAEMLGVPPNDRDQFKRWSTAVAKTVGNPSPEEVSLASIATRELRDYLTPIMEERRQEPREDLLSALVVAEEQGDRLSLDEAFTMATLLLVAGNETTTNLIGNGLLALLRNRREFDALRDDPSLITTGVEELLRYDSPVQLTTRITVDDVELPGACVVRKHQRVAVLLGAANHDPEVYSDPERLDVTRKDNRHVSFGGGSHYCLGAPLARLEGQIALSGIVRRFPDMRLATDRLLWGDNIVLRGLKSLPVTW